MEGAEAGVVAAPVELLPKVKPGVLLPPLGPPLPPKPLLGVLLAAEPNVKPVEGRAEELPSLLLPLLLLLLPNRLVLAGAALEEDEGAAPKPKPPKGLLLVVTAAGGVGLDVEEAEAEAEAPPEELPKPKRNPSSAGLLALPLPPAPDEEDGEEPKPPAEPKPPKVGVGVEDAARAGWAAGAPKEKAGALAVTGAAALLDRSFSSASFPFRSFSCTSSLRRFSSSASASFFAFAFASLSFSNGANPDPSANLKLEMGLSNVGMSLGSCTLLPLAAAAERSETFFPAKEKPPEGMEKVGGAVEGEEEEEEDVGTSAALGGAGAGAALGATKEKLPVVEEDGCEGAAAGAGVELPASFAAPLLPCPSFATNSFLLLSYLSRTPRTRGARSSSSLSPSEAGSSCVASAERRE